MWPYPRLLAHRGGGKLAPENTLAALRLGRERGYRAVEFDVMLAGDDVQAMDAGSWFGPVFAGEPVPSLEAAYRFCMAHGIWMNVEIKPEPGTEARTGQVVAQLVWQLSRQPMAELGVAGSGVLPPLLSSFSPEALLAARQAAPEMPRALLVKAIPADWEKRLQKLGAVALHVQESKLTETLAQAVKAAGYGLFCYTVNDPGRAATLLSWGVDAFCTDRLDLFDPHSPAFRA